MYIIILGAPGAGKGTQADILSQETGLPRIAPGDLFRQALERGTESGLAAKRYMDAGVLVPDEIATEMILERIAEPDCSSGCLLDGFPRTLHQARALDQALEERGESIDKAVYIEVPSEDLAKRLTGRWLCRSCQTPYHEASFPPKTPGKCDKCGGALYQRSDDREETVRGRLSVFFAQTAPVIDYYEQQHKLLRVNGRLSIHEVTAEMMSALKQPMSS